MRRVLPFALALAACTGESGGLTRVAGSGYFDPPSIDFGAQPIGDVARIPVRFTNSSGTGFQVLDVQYEPPADGFGLRLEGGGSLRNSIVGRGASVALEATFGPDREGPVEVMALVQTEDLEIPLELAGVGQRVEPAVLVANPTTVDFGEVAVGGRATQPLTLTNGGERAGRFARAIGRAPFDASLESGAAIPATDLEPGDTIAAEVGFAPLNVGAYDEVVRFLLDGGDQTVVQVRGTAVAAGTLSCAVTSFAFGPVERGDEARIPVTCTATGAYRVGSIVSDSGEIVVASVTPAIGSSVTTLQFELVFRARGVAHAVEADITITATHGEQTVLSVTAEVVDLPASEVDLVAAIDWVASADIDLHLVRQGGLPFMQENDCHFEAPTIDWNTLGEDADDPFLSRDVTNGPAEEQISMENGSTGVYDVFVFLNDGAQLVAVDAEILLRNQAPIPLSRTLDGCGVMWHVGTIRHDLGPPRFEVADTVSTNYMAFADCAN
ncbi:MAG: choice-of-anchor D domain-containing protein [Deltaproteobacteria bacterium]